VPITVKLFQSILLQVSGMTGYERQLRPERWNLSGCELRLWQVENSIRLYVELLAKETNQIVKVGKAESTK